MRAVEAADRHLMGHEGAEPLARKPGVKMQGGRLDLEARLAQMREIEVNSMIGRRADRAGTTREYRERRAMNMPAGDKLDPRMTADDRSQRVGVLQILAIHVPDARDERWMMQEQERRPIRR